MRLEELDVVAEIRAEVAARPEWQDERLQPPDGERDAEDNDRGTFRLRQRGRAVAESHRSSAEPPGLLLRSHALEG
jgi:hypothetical protein